MSCARTGRQVLREAEVIAQEFGMFVAPCVMAPGLTHYVVYRRLPDGRNCRLGRRTTVESLLRWVSLLAGLPAPRSAASSTTGAGRRAAPTPGNTGGHMPDCTNSVRGA